MKETEFYRWWVPDRLTGRLRRTRYVMTAADAQQRYPGCKPDPGSREVRRAPVTPEDRLGATAPYRPRK